MGGAQNHVFDLVTNLSKEKFEPVVVCGLGGDFDKKLNAFGVKTYKITALQKSIKPALDLKALINLILIIRREKPSVVHTHSSKAGLLGRLAAFICRVPMIIFTAHGFVFHEFMSKRKFLFYVYLEKLAGLITDQIIAVSNKDKEKAITNKVVSKEKIITIHNGINTETFKPFNIKKDLIKSSLGIETKEKVVGLIGRLVEEKGIPFFIEAAYEVRKKFPLVKFLVVGDGPLREQLTSHVVSIGLASSFIFAGERNDVEVYLSIMDIVVFSSIKEGLPLALLEAMALERPVVATSVGGIPEVLDSGQNGLIVSPADSGGLSGAIEKLLEDEELKIKIGIAGRKTILKYFSLNRMVTDTGKLYLQLLKDKKLC